MESTFLLHKPVSYRSSVANYVFLMMLLLHIIGGAIAPISAIVSFTARKGSKSHARSGRFFAESMVVVALTGILLDVVRLCFFVKENHTKYAGYTMPSTYPARLGFLFVGLCILYILREVTPPRVFRRQVGGTAFWVMPALLVATGLVLTLIITLRLNPWTGALWMIWTFVLIVVIVARTTSSPSNHRETAVARQGRINTGRDWAGNHSRAKLSSRLELRSQAIPNSKVTKIAPMTLTMGPKCICSPGG